MENGRIALRRSLGATALLGGALVVAGVWTLGGVAIGLGGLLVVLVALIWPLLG